MIVFSANGLEKSFGEDVLFTEVSFELQENDKAGLIGVNGSGKTTLFKIMNGTAECEKGGISKITGLKIGYMEQHVIRSGETSVYLEALSVFSELQEIEKELEKINNSIDSYNYEESTPNNTHKEIPKEILHKQMLLREKFDANGGAVYKNRTMSALAGLGFSKQALEKPVNVLSGGEKSKLQLAKLLLSDVNLMLLDEPTNHLDIESAEWLEKYLKEYKNAFVVISHDRYFLDKVTARTLELENKHLTAYSGGYSEFIKKKEDLREAKQKKYDLTVKEIKRIEGIIAQQKRFNQAHNYVTIASKQKSIDRLEVTLDKPESVPHALRFKFNCRESSGNDVLVIKNLSLTAGNNLLFKNAALNIFKKERVFLLGANGSGKTSLFKAITGEYTPNCGEIKFGARVEIGYYDQTLTGLHDEKTVINEIWDEFPKMNQTEVRTALGQFLFKDDSVFKEILKLSGGEKARVSLLKLMLKGGNLLLLDEPTNHLDITSREALEAALRDYPGTLFIISHDRYLINKLADRIYELKSEKIKEYAGNYDYYIERKGREEVVSVAAANGNAGEYRRRKEQESNEKKLAGKISRLEKKILELEKEQEEINVLLTSPEVASDYEKALSLTEKLNETGKELEKVMEEWSGLV